MFDSRRRERSIRRTLRGLAKQRIVMTQGSWLIAENSIDRNDETEANLRTCEARGWVEVLYANVPHVALTPDLNLPPGFPEGRDRHIYKLTAEGWSVLHRTNLWAIVASLAAIAAVGVAVYYGK